MAGLETGSSDCCTTERQASCCETSEKETCCTPEASSCGCSDTQIAEPAEVRESVRERYVAVALADASDTGCGCAISDVIADEDMDDETRADMRQWTGCIAGALTRRGFEEALTGAGLADLEIRETHRVHQHAAAAIIRARKPALRTSA